MAYLSAIFYQGFASRYALFSEIHVSEKNKWFVYHTESVSVGRGINLVYGYKFRPAWNLLTK